MTTRSATNTMRGCQACGVAHNRRRCIEDLTRHGRVASTESGIDVWSKPVEAKRRCSDLVSRRDVDNKRKARDHEAPRDKKGRHASGEHDREHDRGPHEDARRVDARQGARGLGGGRSQGMGNPAQQRRRRGSIHCEECEPPTGTGDHRQPGDRRTGDRVA